MTPILICTCIILAGTITGALYLPGYIKAKKEKSKSLVISIIKKLKCLYRRN